MQKFVLALMLVLSISGLVAQEKQWKLDKAHSSVGFSVTHMVVSEVLGRFEEFEITLNSSRDDFTDAAVEAVLKTASVTTDNQGRDRDLRGDSFFSAEQYPEVRFKSASFDKVADNKYKITGDLTIRDVTKRVTFDADYKGSLKTQRGTVIAWNATLTINRFDYGLKWDRTIDTGGLVVGEDVLITLRLTFRG